MDTELEKCFAGIPLEERIEVFLASMALEKREANHIRTQILLSLPDRYWDEPNEKKNGKEEEKLVEFY